MDNIFYLTSSCKTDRFSARVDAIRWCAAGAEWM